MAPRDGSQERTGTPDTVEKGLATINTLRYALTLSSDGFVIISVFWNNGVAYHRYRIGVKAFVEKVSPTSDFASILGPSAWLSLRQEFPLQSAGLC